MKTNIELAREAGLLVIGTADGTDAVYTWPKGITSEIDRYTALVEQRLIAKLLEGVGEPIASEESDIATSEIARVMREYNYPANPSNAARVGWRACRQHTAEQLAAAVLAERELAANTAIEKCVDIGAKPTDDWLTVIEKTRIAIHAAIRKGATT